jgi:hypothetical protein
MFYKLLNLLILALLFVTTTIAGAEDSYCINSAWEKTHYENNTRGLVTIYTTTQDPNISDLICILGTEFFSNVFNFPTKNTIGIVNPNTLIGFMLQWSIKNNRFILMKLENQQSLTLMYPDPLIRLGELLSGSTLPELKELPLNQQRFYRGLLFHFTEETLNVLLNKAR